MSGNIAIGIQDFSTIIQGNYFYIDKTPFIKEWWDCGDSATLITRPRRFGKTLTMSMVEQFFSIDYAGRSDLFEHLAIWKEEKYRELQGTYPVISLSFARIKERDYEKTKQKMCEVLRNIYIKFCYIKDSEKLTDADRAYYERMLEENIKETDATSSLYQLSDFLYRYYGKKVIILLDEYDTPMQEAFVDGYWDELVAFTRSLFNSTFKTNPALERGIMTGITRVSKESVFSDLNNLKIVTTTSNEYASVFGFTEKEVFDALEQYGLEKEKKRGKKDGTMVSFFGEHKDIYNPWSILNYLDTQLYKTFWANTSANSLVGKLIQEGNRTIKEKFEKLLYGEYIWSEIEEQIVYNQLNGNEKAVWSLLLASGYLKVLSYETYQDIEEGKMPKYQLALTNLEVKLMFQGMVHDWFAPVQPDYNDFVRAMLLGDVDAMNEYMNRIAIQTFSYFDTGERASGAEPERFYHGFVLGLLVDLRDRYYLKSNRESGFGRYDVMLEPKNSKECKAVILEFKVRNPRKEKSIQETVLSALKQICEKKYDADLLDKGIRKEQIYHYGFAFEGKKSFDWDRQGGVNMPTNIAIGTQENNHMLSVCIITKNEEHNLARCLKSFQNTGFELVVVDTGSTDQTKKIATEYTKNIYDFTWCDDFSAAKNFAVSKATHPYVMVIDSDEYLQKIDLSRSEKMIVEHSGEVGRIQRINIISGKDGKQENKEWINRIFAKESFHYTGRIHEQVTAYDEKEYRTYEAPVFIGHTGYDLPKKEKKAKALRNIRLLEQELKNLGWDAKVHATQLEQNLSKQDTDAEQKSKITDAKKEQQIPYLLYQLGKSYYMAEDYNEACFWFAHGLSYDLEPKLEYVIDMVETYGYALINSGRAGEALFFENIYEEFGNSADFQFLMGLIYMNNAMFDAAVGEFLKAVRHRDCRMARVNSYAAYYNVGVIYECLGKISEAKYYYQKCGSYEPAKKTFKIDKQLNLL